VSERLLEVASANTALNPIVIRVGQICGGPNGFWNEKEWLPSLIRSSVHIRCLPSSEQVISTGWAIIVCHPDIMIFGQKISWIPLTSAAKAIVEMRFSSAQFVHLVHPRPVPWSTVFGAFCSLLAIPLVPYSKWLSRLEGSSQAITTASAKAPTEALKNNPALRLIEFFRSDVMGLASAKGIPLLSLDEAQKASETLRGDKLAQLGIEDVKRWIDYWRSTEFIVK
jgi:thioester reductase-like protein